MGNISHDAVIVVVHSHAIPGPTFHPGSIVCPDVVAWRKMLPAEWRPLVVGPIKQVVNGDVTYAFLPDGSKDGWDTSDEGDNYRQQFIDLFQETFSDGSSPFEVVEVHFGKDPADVGMVGVTYSKPENNRNYGRHA